MKTSILSILLFLSIFFSTVVKSENPCGVMYPSEDTTSWGIGFIRMNLSSHYKMKGYSIIGNSVCYVGGGEITFSNENSPKLSQQDFVYYANYNTILLKVYKIVDTKLMVGINTIKGGVWIEFDELYRLGYDFNTYLSLLANDGNYFRYQDENPLKRSYIKIGVNLLESCLNLRTEPNIHSKIITCIKSEASTRIELLSIENGWANVLVRYFTGESNNGDNPDGCPSTLTKEYNGYVKVMDSRGRPNIWYALSSY